MEADMWKRKCGRGHVEEEVWKRRCGRGNAEEDDLFYGETCCIVVLFSLFVCATLVHATFVHATFVQGSVGR